MSREVSPTVHDPPDHDALSGRLVHDHPRPNGKGARLAVEIVADAAYAWRGREQSKRFIYPAKNGPGSIDAAVAGNPVEQRVQIALCVAGEDDPGPCHEAKRTPLARTVALTAIRNDVVDRAGGLNTFLQLPARPTDGVVQFNAIARDECIDLNLTALVRFNGRRGRRGFGGLHRHARRIPWSEARANPGFPRACPVQVGTG